MERKETIGAAPEVLEAFPQEAEHLRELEEKIALELHAAQESVDKWTRSTGRPSSISPTAGGRATPRRCSRPRCSWGRSTTGGPRRWCTGTG